MNRTEKESFVAELRERFKAAPVVYLTDFTGLNVKSITMLRRTLRESGAEYVVVKNRLARLALQETGLPDIFADLDGPTGVVLGSEDVVGPAKAVTEFAKTNDNRPAFKLGILENQVIRADQIERLAKLPSRDRLLSELAGALEAPLSALAGALEAKVQEMAGLIDALREKRQGESG